jgi:PIN domain nuclease of toxin-antitoxin system
MERYLLDTHVAIWLFRDDKKLSERSKRVFCNISNSIYISIASIWELAIKISIGKMNFTGKVPKFVELVEDNNITILPIETSYLSILDILPSIHRDPFDRILIATAMAEQMTLISADENIARYNVPLIW